jgi:hypothetical protein
MIRTQHFVFTRLGSGLVVVGMGTAHQSLGVRSSIPQSGMRRCCNSRSTATQENLINTLASLDGAPRFGFSCIASKSTHSKRYRGYPIQS